MGSNKVKFFQKVRNHIMTAIVVFLSRFIWILNDSDCIFNTEKNEGDYK